MKNLNDDLYLTYLLFSILLIKLCWIILLGIQYYTQKYDKYDQYEILIDHIKKYTHNIYNIIMGLLLVYLFNNLTTETVCINGRTKELLYTFGILMILGNFQDMLHLKWFPHL